MDETKIAIVITVENKALFGRRVTFTSHCPKADADKAIGRIVEWIRHVLAHEYDEIKSPGLAAAYDPITDDFHFTPTFDPNDLEYLTPPGCSWMRYTDRPAESDDSDGD